MGSGWKPVPPPAPQSRSPIDPEKLQAIRDGLWMVVNGAGTGRSARIAGYDVSGKTGTAQVISNQGKERAGKTDKDLRDNGWFVFFAPRDKPEIAGVVFLEHGVHGANAALVAHHVLDTFFAKKEGRPLPPKPEFKANLVPDCRADSRALRAAAELRTEVFERRLYYHIDWALLIAILALCALGVAMIYSTTADPTRGDVAPVRHAALRHRARPGRDGVHADARLPHVHRQVAPHLHRAARRCCVYVLFFGNGADGRAALDSRSAAFNLQPSEFAKVGVALVLAKFFGENRGAPTLDRSRHRRRAHAHSVRADRQGTGSRHGGHAAAGVSGDRLSRRDADAHPRHRLFLALLLAAPVAWKFALKDYQKSRISTFLDPSQDAKGAGYQQIQARITVGSGGLTGKGFKQGTQGQLRFLPVAHNDFIFSVLAEEQGFAGVLVALGLYLFVILRALEAARLAKDRLGSYLVLGVLASFTFQVVYNITMSAGLAPVKGLTLPLMSYGGSSMIATLAGFGLVLNVRMRRFTN